MNRRDFLKGTIGAGIVAPILSVIASTKDAELRGLEVNRNFQLPHAPNFSIYLESNVAGKLSHSLDAWGTGFWSKRCGVPTKSYMVYLNGSDIGRYNVSSDERGVRLWYVGEVPKEEGKMADMFEDGIVFLDNRGHRFMTRMWSEALNREDIPFP